MSLSTHSCKQALLTLCKEKSAAVQCSLPLALLWHSMLAGTKKTMRKQGEIKVLGTTCGMQSSAEIVQSMRATSS
jgi:hypothetical protein